MVTGVFDAAERLLARWHVEEESKSSELRAARMRDAQSRKGVEGAGKPLSKNARRRQTGWQGDRPASKKIESVCVSSSYHAATADYLVFSFVSRFLFFGLPAPFPSGVQCQMILLR